MKRFGIGQVILGIAVLVLVVLVVYPLSTIIHQSFKFEGHLSLVNYRQIVQKAANFRAGRAWWFVAVGLLITVWGIGSLVTR